MINDETKVLGMVSNYRFHLFEFFLGRVGSPSVNPMLNDLFAKLALDILTRAKVGQDVDVGLTANADKVAEFALANVGDDAAIRKKQVCKTKAMASSLNSYS